MVRLCQPRLGLWSPLLSPPPSQHDENDRNDGKDPNDRYAVAMTA